MAKKWRDRTLPPMGEPSSSLSLSAEPGTAKQFPPQTRKERYLATLPTMPQIEEQERKGTGTLRKYLHPTGKRFVQWYDGGETLVLPDMDAFVRWERSGRKGHTVIDGRMYQTFNGNAYALSEERITLRFNNRQEYDAYVHHSRIGQIPDKTEMPDANTLRDLRQEFQREQYQERRKKQKLASLDKLNDSAWTSPF